MLREALRTIKNRVEELREKQRKALEENAEPLTESESKELKQKSGKLTIWLNNSRAQKGS